MLAIGLAGLGLSGMATSATATATPSSRLIPQVRYAINVPVCAKPSKPGTMRCFAMRKVNVSKGTPGARAYAVPDTIGSGPAGGYTPDHLAAAYGYDPDVDASAQVVAIVDWYDDPDALKDLNSFDTTYGLKKETATSFRKVNQQGLTSPLPTASHAASAEIALDIESVRGVCHTCRILLVEANGPSDTDLATAENRAVTMGATEISNSFGEPEQAVSPSTLAAYNHPGVVITVSTGDDGWFAWDQANDGTSTSADGPEFPSSDPNVIAVGGTALTIGQSGARVSETVWNENGADNQNGLNSGTPLGAGGGGCSLLYAAPAWQSHYAGYAAAGCGGKRLAADIAAIADPELGFDVLDNYASTPGWGTYGGTSLASPVTAALFALAGGSGGARYPAATLYANAAHHPTSLFDVIAGGNGFCGGDDATPCGTAVLNNFGGTHNPNALGGGDVDCSFPRDDSDPVTPPALSSECNAVVGFDGPSGLGAPDNGIGLFRHTNPSVSLTLPKSIRLKKAATFSAKVVEPLAGVTVTTYSWNWGDGHTTKLTTPTTSHTYTKPGHFTVTVTVTDSIYQVSVKKAAITGGKPASVHLSAPTKLAVKKKGSFSTHGTTDPNTGAKITKVSWSWGDGTSTVGFAAKHAFTKAGTYRITIRLLDSTGVTTKVTRNVKVS